MQVTIVGEPEVVIPASAMTCGSKGALDVPDLPPTAFRRGDGQVVLLASNRQNYVAVGPDLNRVRRAGCERILAPLGDADPSQFRDQEWVMGVAPLSGSSMVGVVHDEYHGDLHGQRECPPRRADKLCWYASSTLIVSNDGGMSFRRPPSPENVLAAPIERYVPGREREAMSAPKLIRNGQHLYAMVSLADRNRNVPIQQCLLRADVAAPLVWRAWNGSNFGDQLGSAYAMKRGQDCTGVIRGNVTSVKFLPDKGLYVGLVVARNTLSYVYSPDLIQWSRQSPLRTLSPFMEYNASEGQPDWYFSLLDPTSRTAGFDTLERSPYLYFVHFHTQNGRVELRARDVMRVKIAIN